MFLRFHLFRYAHTFTIEELVRLLRQKISKQKELQAFEVQLQEYKLKDARARYLEEVAAEKTFMRMSHSFRCSRFSLSSDLCFSKRKFASTN